MFENCCSCFYTSSSDTEDEAENRRIKKNIAKKGKTTSVLDKKPFTPKPTSSNPSICSGGSPASSSKITILKRPGFEEEFLNEHNRLRALHGCPPLTLNQELNDLATDWCIRMANKNKMKHSNQDKYGENLFMSVGYSIYGKKVVQTWYEEIMDYNFYKPGYNEKTSNFTQIVWKNTREMGVGQERRDNTTWVTVLYYPPGNRHNKFEANKKPFTPKPTSSNPSICSGGSPASSSKITILKRPGFEEEFLNEHNRLRALHGCPPLTLNQELNDLATDWCIRMANKNKMKHSNQDKYGENLFMSVGYSIYGKKVVQTWYEEIMDYNFYKPGYNEKTSNFTQIVWKNTREMGVGQERRDNTTWVTVLYYPPGNRHNKFEANVPKLLKRDSLLS